MVDDLQSLKALQHKNIVSIKEFILENQQLYFVFEFMDTDLYKIIQKQRFVLAKESFHERVYVRMLRLGRQKIDMC